MSKDRCKFCESGEVWTECCNGAEHCPCKGRQIYAGQCRVCGGSGKAVENPDREANLRMIRGLIYAPGYIGNPYGRSR